jgi:hypothetical protein
MKFFMLIGLFWVGFLAGCEEKKPVVFLNVYGCHVHSVNKEACYKECGNEYLHIEAETMSGAKYYAKTRYKMMHPDSKPEVVSCWDCSRQKLDKLSKDTCDKTF